MSLKRANSITTSTTVAPVAKAARPTIWKRRPTSGSKAPPSVNKMIQNALNKNMETKQWQVNYTRKVLTYYENSSNYQSANVIPLGPDATYFPLTQGTGNANRIGNKIRVKKATLKMIFCPRDYDATNNVDPQPLDIRCLVLHSKNNPTETIVSSTFFDSNNTTQSPQSDIGDMVSSVNKDVYTVSNDRHCKIGFSNFEGTGNSAGHQYYANNDYKLNAVMTIDVTHAFPKNITWNDTSTTPTSFQPYLVVLMAKATGADMGTSTSWYPAYLNSELTLQYYDA